VHRKNRFNHPNAHTRIIAKRAETLFKHIPLRRVVVGEVILEADLQRVGSFQRSLFPSKHELVEQALEAVSSG
jgi:hypothetical protein